MQHRVPITLSQNLVHILCREKSLESSNFCRPNKAGTIPSEFARSFEALHTLFAAKFIHVSTCVSSNTDTTDADVAVVVELAVVDDIGVEVVVVVVVELTVVVDALLVNVEVAEVVVLVIVVVLVVDEAHSSEANEMRLKSALYPLGRASAPIKPRDSFV